jgi:hypothetical protein
VDVLEEEPRGARLGTAGRDAIDHGEDRRQRVLDRAGAALDGGLLGRCAFALRRMLEAERVACLRGGLGEVRRSAVGNELHPGPSPVMTCRPRPRGRLPLPTAHCAT